MKKIVSVAAALALGAIGISDAKAVNPDTTVARVAGPVNDSGLSTVVNTTRHVAWTTHINSSWAHNDVTGVGGGIDNFNRKIWLRCDGADTLVVNAGGSTAADDNLFLTCASGQTLSQAKAELTLL